MDRNGLVTIVADKGSAAGRTVAQNMLTPTVEPSQWSFSQLLAGIMASLATGCMMVVTAGRKVFFSDSVNGINALSAQSEIEDCIQFDPVAGQTGRSLAWTSQKGTPDELTSGELDAIKALGDTLIEAVPQKKSADKLAEDLLALVDSNNEPVFRTVSVDQVNKRVRAYPADKTSGLLAGVATDGNTAVLEVDGDSDPDSPTVPKLPFEGGEV